MSRFILRGLLPALVVLFLLVSAAGCSSMSNSVQGGHSTLSADDGKVLATVLSADSTVVVVGRYALDHISDSEVKDYALSLIVDHQRNYDQVALLASDQNVAPVRLSSYKTQQQVDHAIRKLNSVGAGNSYDVVYLKMQISDQEKTIDALTKLQPVASNDQVREVLKNLLPTMKQDLDHGKALLKDQLPQNMM